MKFGVLIAIFVSTYIAISYSNPNLRKGELIESIIIQQTKGNYADAINLFAVIGNLAKNHTVDLSDKEQKLFFDCYHYRRMQLRKDLVKTGAHIKVLNREAVKIKSIFYNLIHGIIENLAEGSSFQLKRKPGEESHYDSFGKKIVADQDYFQAWYTEERINDNSLQMSYSGYEEALDKLKTFLGDAELTVLDACLGFSTAKLEYNIIRDGSDQTAPSPCEAAQNGLTRGRNASSAGNPDLVPLTQFVSTYCKPDAPNIVREKAFLRLD